MSDEAFARRFYSDRAELLVARRPAPVAARRVHRRGAVHAPLRAVLPAASSSSRTRSSPRSRPRSTCSRASSRTPSRCGSRSRTSRSAGPASPSRRARPPARRGARPRLLARDAGPPREARGRDLEAAHGEVRVLVDLARQGRASGRSTRTRSCTDNGVWYVVGHDLDREGHPHVPRLAHPRRDQVRDAARARLPRADRLRHRAVPRPAAVADRRHRRRGAHRGARRHRLVGAARVRRDRAGSRTASSSPTTPPSPSSRRGCCARTAAPCRSSPTELQPRGRRGAAPRARRATRARRPQPAREKRRCAAPTARVERPRRPGRARALRRPPGAARLPARRVRRGARRREIPAAELLERFPSIPPDELEEHLSLLNLVNFGGGCYTIYAELRDGVGARRQGALGRHVPRSRRA